MCCIIGSIEYNTDVSSQYGDRFHDTPSKPSPNRMYIVKSRANEHPCVLRVADGAVVSLKPHVRPALYLRRPGEISQQMKFLKSCLLADKDRENNL